MATNLWTYEGAPELAADAGPQRIDRTPSLYIPLRKSSKVSIVENGPRLLLEGCHSRIRSFTLVAIRLTLRDTVAPLEQISDAAVSLQRFFGETLPKHVVDEEELLARRVHRWVATADLLEMASQHCAIDATLDELFPLWQQVAEKPEELPTVALELGPPTSELASLWQTHLALEAENFPLLDRLPPETIAEIWREMRDRRLPGTRAA